MKALVYHGPDQRSWDTVKDSTIVDPTDIVVRIDTSTICGSDLHILKGHVPETTPGTVLGHEAVGTVQEVGASVSTVVAGDRVLLSCVTSCGRCRFCKEHRYGQCLGGGGWIFGHLIDGLQAEYARVPFADNSVYKIPEELSDEQVLFLADILPTAFEVGVLNGMVSPGDVVAIVGAGPVGLAAILTAKLYTPGRIVAIDRHRHVEVVDRACAGRGDLVDHLRRDAQVGGVHEVLVPEVAVAEVEADLDVRRDELCAVTQPLDDARLRGLEEGRVEALPDADVLADVPLDGELVVGDRGQDLGDLAVQLTQMRGLDGRARAGLDQHDHRCDR